jgi:hypothetical protein
MIKPLLHRCKEIILQQKGLEPSQDCSHYPLKLKIALLRLATHRYVLLLTYYMQRIKSIQVDTFYYE